jgi:hypothetical protein
VETVRLQNQFDTAGLSSNYAESLTATASLFSLDTAADVLLDGKLRIALAYSASTVV